MTLKIGIYAGTFDPIHKGHVSFALEAIKECGLEKVVLLPETAPRGKENVTPVAQRMETIKQTVSAYGALEATKLEADRFTFASAMPELRRLYLSAQFTLLVGSDVAKTLPQWEDIGELLHECPVVAIGLRGDDTPRAITHLLQPLHAQYGFTLCFCETEHRRKSSTVIRQKFS